MGETLLGECPNDVSALRQKRGQSFAHEIERGLLIAAVVEEMIDLITKGNQRQFQVFADAVSCSPFGELEDRGVGVQARPRGP